MTTFIQDVLSEGLLVLAAVLLGVWVYVAPDHATATLANIKQSLVGVLP